MAIHLTRLFLPAALLLSVARVSAGNGGPTGFPAAQPDSLCGDSPYCLEMRGMVRESKGAQDAQEKAKGLDSAEVLVKNERGVTVIYGLTDHKGRCLFRLPFNRRFTIHVLKKGYVEKMIEVNTRIPAEQEKTCSFTFDVDIFEQIGGLDVSVLSRPIARVHYRPLTKQFVYDAEYTNRVNSELKKMYRDYYALQKANAAPADSVATRPRAKSGAQKKH